MKQQMGSGPTNWFYEQGGNGILNLIRKAMWPTAIVAAALMLFGALGSAVNADDIDGDVRSSSGSSSVIDSDEETAIYVVVDFDADADNDGIMDDANAADSAALEAVIDAAVDAYVADDGAEEAGLLDVEVDLVTALQAAWPNDLGSEVDGPDGVEGNADDGTVDFNGDGDMIDTAPFTAKPLKASLTRAPTADWSLRSRQGFSPVTAPPPLMPPSPPEHLSLRSWVGSRHLRSMKAPPSPSLTLGSTRLS